MKLGRRLKNGIVLLLLALSACLLLPTFALAENTNSLKHSSEMRLKIKLLDGWTEQKDTNGPATFYRKHGQNPLQVSWAEYHGKQPLKKLSQEELKDFATKFGQKNGFGELVESSSGTFAFGDFGTAVFRATKHPRIQVWIIANGSNNILATHICSNEPDKDEVKETKEIVSTLTLGSEN